jgi:hypothetical protein
MIQFVIDENNAGRPTYLNLKGDLIEAILPSDKRYNPKMHDMYLPTPQDSADALITVLKPVAEFILAIGDGNHELKLQNTMNFGKYMAKELGVPHGAYTYVTQFRDSKGKALFKTFSTHGYGSLPKGAKDPLQRIANQKAALKRKLEGTAFFDCIYKSMGHTHKLLVVEPTYLDEIILTTQGTEILSKQVPKVIQNSSYIPSEQCWFANTGGFLKLYTPPGLGLTGYAEMMLLPPTNLGWVEIDIAEGEIIDVYGRKIS